MQRLQKLRKTMHRLVCHYDSFRQTMPKEGHEQKNIILYAFFWLIPWRLNFICRRFGTLCLFNLHRRIGVEFYTYPPMKIE